MTVIVRVLSLLTLFEHRLTALLTELVPFHWTILAATAALTALAMQWAPIWR